MKKQDREQRLKQTIHAIQARWGHLSIRRLSEHGHVSPELVLPTGCEPVDEALGIGGLPKGRLVELVGWGSAGQVSLSASTMRQAQRLGQQVVYVDLEHAIDLDALARCGVNLQTLAVLRPFGLEHGLEMTRDLLMEGGAGMVVFDRIRPDAISPESAQRVDEALREWIPMLDHSLCTLVVLAETDILGTYPPNFPIPYFASVRLSFERQRWTYRGRRVTGLVSKVTVLKNKMGPSGQSAWLRVGLTRRWRGNDDEQNSLCLDPLVCGAGGAAAGKR